MLLDLPSALAGVGIAVLGFVVVLTFCVVVLRLLSVVLPPGPHGDGSPEEAPPSEPQPEATAPVGGDGGEEDSPAT
ncbi:MAG: hypothetical protein JOZ46_02885 [Candidatus Dormibacteraeota bacterium]|nr:hypothetical protein [Candidatus Dormibacteraeota bacterium]MBV9524745.1 hypothetical protein [Candidatus Dormibacteraeota bacterium]